MSIVAMESQCIKTVMIHLIHKKLFHIILSQKTLQMFPIIVAALQSLWTVIFPALSLPSRKFQSVINKNFAKKLEP